MWFWLFFQKQTISLVVSWPKVVQILIFSIKNPATVATFWEKKQESSKEFEKNMTALKSLQKNI